MKKNLNRFLAGHVVFMVTAATAWAGTPSNGDDLIFRRFDDGAGDTSYVIHRYTTENTIDNPSWSFTPPGTVEDVDFLVVGGGGAGGMSASRRTGGGGAGGMIEDSYTLVDSSYSVVVGAGGESSATSESNGNDGDPSSVFDLVALGGGGGGRVNNNGRPGGSGGGAGGQTGENRSGGDGDQPDSASGGYGNDGGNTLGTTEGPGGAGGGGAGGPGELVDNHRDGGDGGIGRISNIDGLGNYYAGGGGGLLRVRGSISGSGGLGGGGGAGDTAEDGLANTGGGGGGGRDYNGAGGSGIVVIRYALADVDEWDEHSRYSLSGSARRVLAEDAVNLRIAANETFSILAGGELLVGEDANLSVQGTLLLGAGTTATAENGPLTIAEGGAIGGPGIIHGGLTLDDGAKFEVVDPDTPLTVSSGTVNLGNLAVDRLILDPMAFELHTAYTLIEGADFVYGDVLFGVEHAAPIGNDRYAYFQQGSLQLVVIPEPHTLGLLLAAGALLAMRRRAKR